MDHTIEELLSELVGSSCLHRESLQTTMLIGILNRVDESHEFPEQSPKWLFLR